VDLKDQKIRLYDTKRHTEGRWLPIYGEMVDAIARRWRQPLGIILNALGSAIVKANVLLTCGPLGQTLAMLLVFLPSCSTTFGVLLLGI
jgi:hypothetical protein